MTKLTKNENKLVNKVLNELGIYFTMFHDSEIKKHYTHKIILDSYIELLKEIDIEILYRYDERSSERYYRICDIDVTKKNDVVFTGKVNLSHLTAFDCDFTESLI